MVSRSRFGFVAVLLWTSAAGAASDNKVYNGSFCRPTGGTIFYSYTGVTCNSAGGCDLVCPFVRDLISDADTISSVNVEVSNATSAASLSCTVYMMDDDANGGSDVDAANVTKTGSGKQDLFYNAAALDADTGDEGSYVMLCSLQQNDMLYQTLVVEETALGGSE